MLNGNALALLLALGNLVVSSAGLYFILKMIHNDIHHLRDVMDQHLRDHAQQRHGERFGE